MDIIKQLGTLALASRFRRLADRFSQDVSQIYHDHEIDFEPRWFMVFYALSSESPQSICDLAEKIGITHPMVNQIAGDMIKAGILDAIKDENDKRKRLLALSAKGEALLPMVKPIWEDIGKAAGKLIQSMSFNLMAALEELEHTLDNESFYDRVSAHMKTRQLDAVEIVENDPRCFEHFKTLNLEWIEKYFHVEPDDIRLLGNPQEEIIDPGGCVFFARYQDEIVGTCALLKISDEEYDLIRMAVTEDAQGKQIGKKLMLAAIAKASSLGATRIILETHHTLLKAQNMYRRFGFRQIPYDATHQPGMARSDIRMKLDLEPTSNRRAHPETLHVA